ncbi:MAG: hypothetical protein ACRDLV_01635, partial [Solirubrobacteraceae bacterium]
MSVAGQELLRDADASDATVELLAGEIVALSPRQLFWRRFREDRVAMASAIVIVAVIVV